MLRVSALLIATAFGFAFIAPALAEELVWRCTVTEAWVVSDKGRWITAAEAGFAGEKIYRAATFEVSWETGRISGGPLQTAPDTKRNMLHGGDKLLLWPNGMGMKAEFFTVSSHVEGDQKPFVAVGYLDTVYTGTCT